MLNPSSRVHLFIAVLFTLLITATSATARQQSSASSASQSEKKVAPVQTVTTAVMPTGLTLEERTSLLEERMNLALALKDEKIQQIQDRVESVYKLIQFAVALTTVVLAFFSVRDFLFRAKEAQRQRGIDDIVKETMKLQNAVMGQQASFGGLQLKAAQAAAEGSYQQFDPVKNVGEVIQVIKDTLAFRLQEEARVVETIQKIERIEEERKRIRKQKYDSAIGVLDQFKKMNRMQFAALAPEQYKRGIKLQGLVNELDDVLNEEQFKEKDFQVAGSLQYTCGVIAYYDNDVVEARARLDRAAECRAKDHEGELKTNEEYRLRFAFVHYFRALIQKNWGSINDALSEIGESARLLANRPSELLTPVTKAEIGSYVVGQEEGTKAELEELLRKISELESSLKNSGEDLNGNQKRLRNRVLLLLGNVYFVSRDFENALGRYAEAQKFNSNDYYALASTAQCNHALGNVSAAADEFRACLDAIERSGDFRRKRERITLAGIAVLAAVAAKGCGDDGRYEQYARDARDMLAGNLDVDGMSPKFFSPSTKRLVSSAELLKEMEQA